MSCIYNWLIGTQGNLPSILSCSDKHWQANILFFVCKISMKSETGAFLTYSPALQDELSLTDIATKSSSTALTLKALGTAASTYLTLGWCRGKWRTARHQCGKSIKIQVEVFSADMTNTLFGSTLGKKQFAQTSCPHMPSIQNQILSPYLRVRYWYWEWRGRPSRASAAGGRLEMSWNEVKIHIDDSSSSGRRQEPVWRIRIMQIKTDR